MDVLLLNAVALNGGDAAIVLAAQRHVREALGPDARLLVSDAAREESARRHPDMTFVAPLSGRLTRRRRGRAGGGTLLALDRARWLAAARARVSARGLSDLLLRPAERRALGTYARADAALSTGGTYLVEHYDVGPKLFELRVALALGLPLALYTQSLGPFTARATRRAVGAIGRRARAVLVRDERSRGHLLEVGVPGERVAVLADGVFTFAGSSRRRARIGTPTRVAVSVRDWSHGARGAAGYEDAVRALVVHLVRERGAEVTFLSTCQGVPAYVTDDARAAARIAAELPPDVAAHVRVDGSFRRPETLMDDIARDVDLVVATRMHMAILSLDAGVPVLPIAYEFKTRELFTRLGWGRHVTDFDDAQGDRLVQAFEALLAEDDLAPLWAAVDAERRLADGAVERLRTLAE